MEFREYAEVRFAKENKDNGLSMDKDYPDGLRDRIMNRLDAIFGSAFCLGLIRDIEKEGKNKCSSLEKTKSEYQERERDIAELEEKYRLSGKKDTAYEERIEKKIDKLNDLREKKESLEKKLYDYPMGKVNLFSNITIDEMALFDYILDILSVQSAKNEKNVYIDILRTVQKGLWEKISKDNRIKLLQLLEKAVDSDGDLWVTEKCWKETCNKIMYPVQYRIKHNLVDLLELIDEQQISPYQEVEWLQELDKKIVNLRKKYIPEKTVEEDILEQIEKYIQQ